MNQSGALPSTTLFAMTVDTEEEWAWGHGWPRTAYGVENVVQRLARFQDLCSRHRVATTYFVNKAVLDDRAAGEVVREIAGRERVEVGMHIHPWNTPPFDRREVVSSHETYLHNLPEAMIEAKLRSVHGSFLDRGFRPLSFRGGRYSSGSAIRPHLRRMGFLTDVSVVPFTSWKEEGAPDYAHRGLSPVRWPPDAEFQSAFWEIPLTLGFTRRPFNVWAALYRFIEKTWLHKLHVIGVLERLRLVRKAWLNFEDPLGRGMLLFLETLRDLRPPCLCFTVHSSSLLAGKSLYTPTASEECRLFNQLEEVLATLAAWPEFESATVAEVARRLEGAQHARPGH